MAAKTATQVTSGYAAQPFPIAGYHVEIWRVPAGSTSTSDTCTITPARGRFVASVIGGALSNNLTSAGTNTSVTLTYDVTTSGTTDVLVLVQE